MVRLRLDRRLQGRLDPSDVLQEAYLDFAQRVAEYARNPTMPFFLWLRFLAGQKLIDLHRQHLGAKMRDAGQEVSLYRGALPQASSVSLAAQLLGRLTSRQPGGHPGRAADPRAGSPQRHGPDGPRGPDAAALRDAEQRRNGGRAWTSASRRPAIATSGP